MNVAKLEIIFPSNLKFVKTTVSDILSFIEANTQNYNHGHMFDLKLIYNELLINSILHGNQQDEQKMVKVFIATNQKDLIFSYIEDEGLGFNYKKQLHKTQSSSDFFLESGRGLQLVSGLSDRVRFNKQGNKIIFFQKGEING